MKKQLAADGTEAVGSTPLAFANLLPSDIALWAQLVNLSGAVIE